MAMKRRSASVKQKRTKPTMPRTSSATRPAASKSPVENSLKQEEAKIRKMIASKPKGEPLTEAELAKLHAHLRKSIVTTEGHLTTHLDDGSCKKEKVLPETTEDALAALEDISNTVAVENSALEEEPIPSDVELDRRAADRECQLKFIGGYLARRLGQPEVAEKEEVKAAAAILLDFVHHNDAFQKWNTLFVWEYGRHMYQGNESLFWRSLHLLLEIGVLKICDPDGKCIDDPNVLEERPRPISTEENRRRGAEGHWYVPLDNDIPPMSRWEPAFIIVWGDRVPPLYEFLDLMHKGTQSAKETAVPQEVGPGDKHPGDAPPFSDMLKAAFRLNGISADELAKKLRPHGIKVGKEAVRKWARNAHEGRGDPPPRGLFGFARFCWQEDPKSEWLFLWDSILVQLKREKVDAAERRDKAIPTNPYKAGEEGIDIRGEDKPEAELTGTPTPDQKLKEDGRRKCAKCGKQVGDQYCSRCKVSMTKYCKDCHDTIKGHPAPSGGPVVSPD